MSDFAASYIRTVWPTIMGTLAGLLATWLAAHAGVRIDSTVVLAGVTAVSIVVVYGAGRWLESRQAPVLRAAGRFLLSLGLKTGQPTYQANTNRLAGLWQGPTKSTR